MVLKNLWKFDHLVTLSVGSRRLICRKMRNFAALGANHSPGTQHNEKNPKKNLGNHRQVPESEVLVLRRHLRRIYYFDCVERKSAA